MKGWLELKTVQDLLRKLERDFEKLRDSPHDVDLAFNFFVTAEHLLDWQYPGRANTTQRTNEREQDILLKVTSHLANGAKHFKVEAKHHKSVKNADQGGGCFPKGYWAKRMFPPGYWGDHLYFELQKEAIKELGTRITVLELAKKVLRRWQEKLKGP
jgi:hypothetical protein